MRRRAIEAGIAAVGVAGGVTAGQALRRRSRPQPRTAERVPELREGPAVLDAVADVEPGGPGLPAGPGAELLLPDGVEVEVLTLSDGTEMRVLVRGSGPAVVLIHGITLAADIWFNQLRDLGDAGFCVVAPDLRGHGRSTVGSGGLDLDRVAGDIAELFVALDLDDVVLVGHSMGGMLALGLLARLEEEGDGARARPRTLRRDGARSGDDVLRIRALGLVATSASPVVGRGVPGARAVMALVAPVLGATGRLTSSLLGPSLPDTAIGHPLARATFGSAPAAADVRLVRRLTSAVPARIAAALLLQLLSFDAEAELGRVAVPTTVVVGTHDLMTPLRHAETLAHAIAGAELVVLPGCGHMVMLERPTELAAAISDLARRAGLAPRPA